MRYPQTLPCHAQHLRTGACSHSWGESNGAPALNLSWTMPRRSWSRSISRSPDRWGDARASDRRRASHESGERIAFSQLGACEQQGLVAQARHEDALSAEQQGSRQSGKAVSGGGSNGQESHRSTMPPRSKSILCKRLRNESSNKPDPIRRPPASCTRAPSIHDLAKRTTRFARSCAHART